MKINNIKKISIIGLIFLSLTFIFLTIQMPITGYELSFYQGFSPLLWIFMVLTLSIGIMISISCTLIEKKTNLWKIGIFLMTSVTLIMLSMPLLKGYHYYGMDDALTHLGYSIDILNNAYVGSQNFYPFTHIQIVIFSLILPIESINLSAMIITPLFYVIYILGIILLANTISKTFKQKLLILIFALLPSIGIYSPDLYPIGVGFMMIPLFLYLFFERNREIEFAILFVILCFTLVFIHSLISLFLIMIILIYIFSKFIEKKLNMDNNSYRQIFSQNFNSAILICTVFITWISSYFIFGKQISTLLGWLNKEYSATYLEGFTSAISKANFTITDTIILIIKNYSVDIFLSILLIISVIYTLRNFLNRKQLIQNSIFFILSGIFLLIISLTFLLSGLSAFSYPLRYLILAFVFVALSVGLISENIFYKKSKYKKAYMSLLFIGLLITSTFGLFSIHNSPYKETPTPDVSIGEYNSGSWLAINSKTSDRILIVGSPLGSRMRVATLGYEKGNRNAIGIVNEHFGYAGNNSIHDYKTKPSYIFLSEFDIKYYSELWPTQGKFISTDFDKFRQDSRINLIYNNGANSIYFLWS